MKAALLVVLGFVALFFPQWGLQAVSLLIFATVVLSWLYSRLTRRALTARRKDPVLRGHRQERMEVRLALANRGPLPVHFFLARDIDAGLSAGVPAGSRPQLFQGLGPWQKVDFSYTIESHRRGEYTLGPVVLRGGDPLGLFRWEKRTAGTQRVIVYPRVLPVAVPADSGLPAGSINTLDRAYEDVTRYRSLREYVPGDDTRRIAWKASARLGSLHTIEYLATLYFPALILLDLSIEDYPERGRYSMMERAIEVAASLVGHFSALGQDVGLVSSGHLEEPGLTVYVPIKGGAAAAVVLLEILARIAPSPGEASFSAMVLGRNLRLPAGGRLCVVAPVLRADQEAFVASARARGQNVELFLLAAGAGAARMPRGVRGWRVRDYGEELIERA